jgi:uncharacterized protein
MWHPGSNRDQPFGDFGFGFSEFASRRAGNGELAGWSDGRGSETGALTAEDLRRRLKTMEFKVSELEREPIEFDLELAPGAVDLGEEAEQVGDLATSGLAEVIHEHRGPKDIVADIRLRGQMKGRFTAPCARCVEPVEVPVETEFDLIFRPVEADTEAAERSITAPETEICYYQKDSLLLEDVLREQVLLSLPVRTLCKPDCKGLCPRCGQNRNTQECSCDVGPSDPRWEALAGLKERIKP